MGVVTRVWVAAAVGWRQGAGGLRAQWPRLLLARRDNALAHDSKTSCEFTRIKPPTRNLSRNGGGRVPLFRLSNGIHTAIGLTLTLLKIT